jgi:hypothetical protein
MLQCIAPPRGTWYTLRSSTNYATYVSYQWGISTDTLVQADYEGDGKTDIAIYRPSTGTWYILKSSTGGSGTTGDIPLLDGR